MERTVNFANLGSGGYRFEVRALSADGLYSPTAVVGFSVATPLWKRWWFAAGVLLLTAFIIYTFYRYRLQRLLELERMRTRIATDLHDDIGANLTRIAILSEVAKQQATNGSSALKRELLPSIADIARESVASMNDIVWAISPDHDSLLDLTRRMRQHADEVFTLRDVELEFNALSPESDLRLGVDIRRDLLLIFKEAVNNAAKHSGCSKVQIDFGCRDSVLNLSIKDNGSGFAAFDDNDGHGLRNMARRAEAHGGRLTIVSPPGTGTLVEFELRLPRKGQF
jgi:signal transduction histidine kinase